MSKILVLTHSSVLAGKIKGSISPALLILSVQPTETTRSCLIRDRQMCSRLKVKANSCPRRGLRAMDHFVAFIAYLGQVI
ncbi:hypothetical protein Q8A67_025845 [Cirrhinus molitorella]|uniref:Uncharacterized protein n=1 Tax=Cirrhinus molitorella TaxID=172907 RepID=A0AA88P0D7_9TELE|nr:hypothetical protein Q8A67_025845 [Cirrhinus molitorella]